MTTLTQVSSRPGRLDAKTPHQSKLSPNTVLLEVLGFRARMKTKACLAMTENLQAVTAAA